MSIIRRFAFPPDTYVLMEEIPIASVRVEDDGDWYFSLFYIISTRGITSM